MLPAVPPGPDSVSAASQIAGIHALIRVAQIQERGYVHDALGYAVPAARRPVDDRPPAHRHRRQAAR